MDKHVVVEELLEPLVGEVDAQLLKGVQLDEEEEEEEEEEEMEVEIEEETRLRKSKRKDAGSWVFLCVCILFSYLEDFKASNVKYSNEGLFATLSESG